MGPASRLPAAVPRVLLRKYPAEAMPITEVGEAPKR